MAESVFRHGYQGMVKLDGADADTFTELDCDSWEMTEQVDMHRVGGFKSQGARRNIGGEWNATIRLQINARSDEQIRAGTANLKPRNIIPAELYEDRAGTPHTGNVVIESVQRQVQSNGNIRYTIQGQNDDAWAMADDVNAVPVP